MDGWEYLYEPLITRRATEAPGVIVKGPPETFQRIVIGLDLGAFYRDDLARLGISR